MTIDFDNSNADGLQLRTQTVIILDWDDTVLPSAFLEAWTRDNGHALPPALLSDLREVQERVIWLLEQALQIGKTYIVTNAEKRWVDISATKYMPGLLTLLKRIPVVSAREMYQGKFQDNVSLWKLKAFLYLQRKWDVETPVRLIAIGDSDYEMNAAHKTMKVFNRKAVKATGRSRCGCYTIVKFKEAPTPRVLLQQLNLLMLRFDELVHNNDNLSITFHLRPV